MNQKLQSYLLFILSKKDYSQHDIRIKCAQKGYSTEETEEAITWLKELNYLNDTRYAENVIQAKLGMRGVLWIKQKLNSKGIAADIVEEALSKCEIRPNQQLKTMVESKYGVDNWQEVEPKTMQKIIGYVGRRGFTNAWEIVKNWKEEASNQND